MYTVSACFLSPKKKCPLIFEINFPDDCPELSPATNLCKEWKHNFHRYESIKISWQFRFV
jgi:hypothetical protein